MVKHYIINTQQLNEEKMDGSVLSYITTTLSSPLTLSNTADASLISRKIPDYEIKPM